MLPLLLGENKKRLRILCLGAHSDDIEIGCAGSLLRWLQDYQRVEITWAVLCASDTRGEEANRSVQALLRSATSVDIALGDFEDSYLPADFRRVKQFVTALRQRAQPDLVLTHSLDDRHQDHRLIAELTWQTWRNHLILEYEIPKYEGDLGQPNLFVPLSAAIARRKLHHLATHFATQRGKHWFNQETFIALMRLRGVECRARSGFAEAFRVRKAVV